ncbi:MAG: MgtC/SapB family protein [Nitrospirae bacterium]|nr:MAG: MgtC/SapB family protein [Nitrospirota bacterium]
MSTMSFEEIFLGFLIALAAGSLIGLEREQSRVLEKKPGLIGGVRTFPLIALAGALSALIAHAAGAWAIAGGLLVMGLFLAISYYQEWSRDLAPGVTTQVAALITFLLGVLALLPGLPLATAQRYLLIVASASVVMALLSFKAPLHHAVERVSEDDIYATAKFVILALVVLPLLPDRTVGPLDVLNPFNIGLMIVLIAGISFLGYLATRIIGERQGLAVTGILGGLVSSTAVTVSLAGRVRESPRVLTLAAVGILTASATMFVRILAIVGIIDLGLLPVLLWPLGAMAASGYGVALAFYLSSRHDLPETQPVSHRNPFELRAALQFGLFYACVIFVAKAAHTFLGDRGLYASSVLAGTTEVDAISLSMARFHLDGLAASTAATAITLAAVTNTAVKAGLAFWLGGSGLATRVLLGLGAVLGAGGLALMLAR